MSIVIGADIVPSLNNAEAFAKGDVECLLGEELAKVLNDADYRVFNLETPLVDKASPIMKVGRTLNAACSTVNGIKKIGADLLTLANNHIMDQGEIGLSSTISLLNNNAINYLGAGCNLKEAQRPYIISVKGKKIGVYACVEHEFSIANENVPGANPFDALESFDHVAKLRESCDYLIVLYHGGKEHYPYPSPILQRVCRKFVERGANLVACQHSHCIGCEEKYLDGTIVYGQGNFLFDSNHGPFSSTSLLICLNDDFSIQYLPLIKVDKGVRLASGKNADVILSGFNDRSNQIKKEGFVKKEYEKFAQKKLVGYMLACSGYNHKVWLRLINSLCGRRLTKRISNSYTLKELLALRNFIECEAHRELWIEGLKGL